MRHYSFALLAVASVLLCACAKEEQTTGYTRKSITATIDGNSQTRAAVRDVNIVWTDDDAIRVFNADGFASEVWNISDDDSGLETARFFFIGEPQLASLSHFKRSQPWSFASGLFRAWKHSKRVL